MVSTVGVPIQRKGKVTHPCPKCGAKPYSRCIIWRHLPDNTKHFERYAKHYHAERGRPRQLVDATRTEMATDLLFGVIDSMALARVRGTLGILIADDPEASVIRPYKGGEVR